MITEPPTDGQRTPLQEYETLYIGGRSLPSFAGPWSEMTGQIKLRAIAKEI
jgi:hypothetical protein